jgi:FtsH-binding integral membrane protein
MEGGGSFGNFGNLTNLLNDKIGFLSAVFGTLIFELLIVSAIFKFIPNDDPIMTTFKQFAIPMVILQFIVILCIALVPMPIPLKFALFTLFATLTGFIIKVSLQNVNTEIIQTALFATIAIFVAFVVVGLIVTGFGIDLAPLAVFLFGFLILVIITSIVSLFMKTSSGLRKGIAVFTIFLFSVFLVFDTNQILQRDYNGDFVTASIDYFLDIINIFINLVSYMRE